MRHGRVWFWSAANDMCLSPHQRRPLVWKQDKTLRDMLIPAVRKPLARLFSANLPSQYLRFVRALRPRRSNELPHRFPQQVYREGYHWQIYRAGSPGYSNLGRLINFVISAESCLIWSAKANELLPSSLFFWFLVKLTIKTVLSKWCIGVSLFGTQATIHNCCLKDREIIRRVILLPLGAGNRGLMWKTAEE